MMRIGRAVGGAVAVAVAGLATSALAAPKPSPADLVVVDAKVFTATSSTAIAQAFAVRGDKFVAVGTNSAIRAYIGSQTKVVDAKGRLVTPGLTDAHFHSEGGGPGVDLSKAANLKEIFAALKARAQIANPGEVIVSNQDWHEAQLTENRLPSAEELTEAVPDHPVVLVRGGHSFILNTVALKLWGISLQTPVPSDGAVPRDAAGNLTGELIDGAKGLAKVPPPPAITEAEVLRTDATLNSFGITSARVPGGYKSDPFVAYALFRQVAKEGKATVRFNVLLSNFAGQNASEASFLERFRASGLKQGDGDDWVRIGGIKMIVDGGFEGEHTLEPYAEPYGHAGTYFGIIVTPPERYTPLVRALNRDGWTVATHAAGDAAVEQVLQAYAAANADRSIAGRHFAIEHAFLSNKDQQNRAKALDLTLSVQDHLFVAGPVFKKFLGAPRAERITPLKTYLEEGQHLALGTDSPVIPVNPFWELYHYITRETRSDGVYGANQQVTDRGALLRIMTEGYAELTGETAVKGTIAAGKYADFAIYKTDLLTAPPAEVRDTKVLATYVGGRLAYQAPLSP